MKNLVTFSTLGLLAIFGAAAAHADTVTANTVIYAAGNQSGIASAAGGIAPTEIVVNGATSYTFSASGTVVINNGSGNNSNNPDGVGAAPANSSNTGTTSISGITAPDAGYLVGVFLAAGGPGVSAPPSLDFTSSGLGTGFTSLSPLIDQVFFIGDGLTGNGTGSIQQFIVPTGATGLYLGISDAAGYNGSPGAYGDNLDSFTVTVNPAGSTTSPVPEPSSLILFGTGILGAAGAVRRRFQTA